MKLLNNFIIIHNRNSNLRWKYLQNSSMSSLIVSFKIDENFMELHSFDFLALTYHLMMQHQFWTLICQYVEPVVLNIEIFYTSKQYKLMCGLDGIIKANYIIRFNGIFISQLRFKYKQFFILNHYTMLRKNCLDIQLCLKQISIHQDEQTLF